MAGVVHAIVNKGMVKTQTTQMLYILSSKHDCPWIYTTTYHLCSHNRF